MAFFSRELFHMRIAFSVKVSAMKLRKRLAKRLKLLQGETTQAEFSRRIGIGQASLNRILRSEQSVSLDLLETICNSLRLDIVDRLKEDPPKSFDPLPFNQRM